MNIPEDNLTGKK